MTTAYPAYGERKTVTTMHSQLSTTVPSIDSVDYDNRMNAQLTGIPDEGEAQVSLRISCCLQRKLTFLGLRVLYAYSVVDYCYQKNHDRKYSDRKNSGRSLRW